MRLRRGLLLVGAAGAAGAAGLWAWRRGPGRARTGDAGMAVARRSRTDRNVEMAALSARVGATVAGNRARRVFASAARREALDSELQLRTAEEVARALGSMKGALMKVGQMASYLDDGLPEPVRQALAQLQQDAPPMSAELAAEVVERELGLPPDKAFAEWDPQPIAAASIGQVHRAITHDDVAVAVKVQYPGVEEAIRSDLDNAAFLFNVMRLAFPGIDPEPMVDELRARLTEELDYRTEAANQAFFADAYRGHPFIHVPDVIAPLSTTRVLTTELATGARFSEIVEWSQEERNLAGETIYRFVFRSLNRLLVFNGDPHPGNYLFRPGGHVTFLDFGLVKRFELEHVLVLQELIVHMVLTPDEEAFRATLERGGFLRAGAPVSTSELVALYRDFYRPILRREPFAITHEFASHMVQQMFPMSEDNRRLGQSGNVPGDFLLLMRINLGLYAVLAQLGAVNNWRAMGEEFWPITDAGPATPMGEQEHAWLATRRGHPPWDRA